jgi:Flp pilus assembly protein TadG
MGPAKMISDRKGAALVEFAIVMPLLFALVFGIIEFGIILYNKAMLTNASREGARLGIVYNSLTRPTVTDIKETVEKYCSSLITFGGSNNPTLDPLPTPCVNSGDPLTVTVKFPYQFLVLPNFVFELSDTDHLNLKAVTTMRCE